MIKQNALKKKRNPHKILPKMYLALKKKWDENVVMSKNFLAKKCNGDH